MIKREKVEHISALARLGLSEKERERMQKELSSILDYIRLLEEVDIADIAVFQSQALKNVMREDRENEKSKKKNEKLLELAPQTKDGYIKVKAIL